MFRLNNMIRAACVTAFASVALSIFASSSAHAADAPASNLPAGAVAVVNGVPVPQSQLDDAVKMVTAKTGQPDTPQLRQMLRSGLIAREVLRQNAEKAHYDQKPEVQQALATAKVGTEIQLYLKDSIHPEAVTDAQVKARYDEIAASLGKDEFKPRVITVGDEVTAKKVLDKMKAGQPFEALAKEYSVAPSKANGGEMPWISFPVPVTEGRTQGLPMALAQTISKLPVGGATPLPVQVGNVWVIVKLDAKRPTQVPAFDQAKDAMRKQLETLAMEKAAAQFTGNQLKNASIQQ
ncbi:parvulin-like peptidyl-prolyl cis-trans isomerase protein [Paraburkholderia sp. RAU2J]|uniref:peptidylprolyl isomerase n=1 Tax=Paraburkholderia sp. RAU2J TaxID=1938810 RepID=UPI000F159D49|nr:peptidyl-prolyl cis-trans isomerase [Paraburkholderia sp. RAU2J]RKT25640.1 parvulin-like peptidyl-prolyl cis-trans isomerase protein [Paraburkholderia sp. RAU2J]